MEKVFVKVWFDLECQWEGLAPTYRIYVNDELFNERTFVWTNCYLEEMLQIQAAPGQYTVRIEPVGPHLALFRRSNPRVEYGPARWINESCLEILDESQ